jgi:D-serine deaminase-like pyridoxal phosphate-dependent protein
MAATSNTPSPTLKEIPTPSLVLDPRRMMANIDRMKRRMERLGVSFRPHLKTAKSADIARLTMSSPTGPATVSTLKEAEEFATAGVTDMTYAVGIAPDKLERVSALRNRGVDLSIIVDSVEAAEAVAAHATRTGDPIPVLVEIDSDGHRAGLKPSQGEAIVAVGRTLIALIENHQREDGTVRVPASLQEFGLPESIPTV